MPPVNALTGFPAVPNLGLVIVQPPAAELASLGAAAAHAGLGGVEVVFEVSSSVYVEIMLIKVSC